MATVLVADDDSVLLDTVRAALASAGHDTITVDSGRAAVAALSRAEIDVVLTDVAMPGLTGIELCEYVVGNRPDVPTIVMTGHSQMDIAVAAIRAGAYDFLIKPISLPALLVSVERAARHRSLLHKLTRLEKANEPTEIDGVIGQSSSMLRVLDVVRRVADTDASVLIGGPSGSGKEVIARLLHRNSQRRDFPFVSINCAALPEALLESELFGHVKGAFTDARQAHGGLFLQAQGGTFFLDEIGDMPLGLQPKLLRALQERTVRAVGSSAEIPIDVRVVSATNQDIDTAVHEKRFRADLFFRLDVVRINLPPLRARGTDILLLAKHFLEQFAARAAKPVRTISPTAAAKLLAYDWPGNVRELQNSMEHAIALGRYDAIGLDDLPDRIREASPTMLTLPLGDPSLLMTLRELEERYIVRVMSVVAGNKTVAAKILGIDRKTLYRKLDSLPDRGSALPTDSY